MIKNEKKKKKWKKKMKKKMKNEKMKNKKVQIKILYIYGFFRFQSFFSVSHKYSYYL